LCKKGITVAEGCLDHDHYTGVVRGVLCRNCNGMEGKIKNLAVRGKRALSIMQYLANIVRYWVYHSVDRTGLVHPTHLTDDEKRVKRNTKARKARAAKKVS
jgi:Recombination endonuclease VII